MSDRRAKPIGIDDPADLGAPLPPWTYTSPELFELEYDAFFLRRWQFVGHVSEVTGVGEFMTADIGRDNVIVIRGKDEMLRGFLNVCRHRGSRLLDGSGHCQGVIKCPYHGWTYRLDGSLLGVPQEENFPDFDRNDYGLHEIQIEVFYGFVFVRVHGDGRSVAEQFSHTARFFELYGVEDYVPCLRASTQVWDVNWKVAWDNYLENYHIAVGHPGLNRLLTVTEDFEELESGVSYGVFDLKERPSKVGTEHRLPRHRSLSGVTGYLPTDPARPRKDRRLHGLLRASRSDARRATVAGAEHRDQRSGQR